MEHSDPSIYKSLIDYSELQRLKHIEELYNELKKASANCRCSSHSQSHVEKEKLIQFGQGSESAPFVFSDIPLQSKEEAKTLQPQGVEQPEPQPGPSVSTLVYDVQMTKSDDHSQYDEESLLTHVPVASRKNARLLLKQIDSRGEELTFNSTGTIFIDQIAIPNSNIYVLFPLLFKKRPSSLVGYSELISKINDMGLNSLISNRKLSVQITKPMSEGFAPTTVPWYYIGD